MQADWRETVCADSIGVRWGLSVCKVIGWIWGCKKKEAVVEN